MPCAVQPDVELRSVIIDFDASSRFPHKIERLAVSLKYTTRFSRQRTAKWTLLSWMASTHYFLACSLTDTILVWFREN